jgi:hypothetical protein
MTNLDYQALGFDLDEETVEVFDAILRNVLTDKELNDEFKKLKFVQKLHDNYDETKGPIRQIIEKLGKIEKDYDTILNEHLKVQRDMRRAVADMTETTRTIRTAAMTQDTNSKYEALKRLEGLEYRQNSYTWNDK